MSALLSPLRHMRLLRQGSQFIVIGVLQLLVDWLVLVTSTAAGVPVSIGNLLGRSGGAVLGFWLNGRYTFADAGQSRLCRAAMLRFVLLWLLLTALSTWLIAWAHATYGLRWAWLAKPVVEGTLSLLSFVLMRQLVFR
jgi:putative flippase GtrA